MFGGLGMLKAVLKHPLTWLLLATTVAGAGVSVWKWIAAANLRADLASCHTKFARYQAGIYEQAQQNLAKALAAQRAQDAKDLAVWREKAAAAASAGRASEQQAHNDAAIASRLRKELEDAYAKTGARDCSNQPVPHAVLERLREQLAPAAASAAGHAHPAPNPLRPPGPAQSTGP